MISGVTQTLSENRRPVYRDFAKEMDFYQLTAWQEDIQAPVSITFRVRPFKSGVSGTHAARVVEIYDIKELNVPVQSSQALVAQ